jgi:hypothetical protein
MITSDAVERACAEVGDFTEEQMASEFERFFKAQPELCDFIVELTSESEQRIQELSLFLSYMVLKAVEGGNPSGVPAVSPEKIEAAFKDSETWIERINQAQNPELQTSVLSNLAADTEPFLLQYVISEINQPLDDGTQLADEQKGEVFFVLKTVITTLSGNRIEHP